MTTPAQNLTPSALPQNRQSAPGAIHAFHSGLAITIIGLALLSYVYYNHTLAATEAALLAGAQHNLPVSFDLPTDAAARALLIFFTGLSAVAVLAIGLGLALTGLITWAATRHQYPPGGKPLWLLWPFLPMLAYTLTFLLMAAYAFAVYNYYPLKPAEWINEQAAFQRQVAETARQAQLADEKQKQEIRNQNYAAFAAYAEKLNSTDPTTRSETVEDIVAHGYVDLYTLPEPARGRFLQGLRNTRQAALTDPEIERYYTQAAEFLGDKKEMKQYFDDHRAEAVDPKSPAALREAGLAIQDRRNKALATLLDRGLPANTPGHNPGNLLCLAADLPNLPAAELLFQHKADPNLPGFEGQTPLYHALARCAELTRYNYADQCAHFYPIIDLLLAQHADPNLKVTLDYQPQQTHLPIMAALDADDPEILRRLIEHHVNTNVLIDPYQTPLDYLRTTSGKHKTALEKLLLDNGAKTAAQLQAASQPATLP